MHVCASDLAPERMSPECAPRRGHHDRAEYPLTGRLTRRGHDYFETCVCGLILAASALGDGEPTMAREGTQRKLERVRPPRVNISYDVETGGAIETRELPFVMGIFADLSGQPAEALPRLKERQVGEVTPDNFDTVLKSAKPRGAFAGGNQLGGE